MFQKKYRLNKFSLEDTLECGQVFRFNRVNENEFEGIAKNKYAIVKQVEDTIIVKTHEQTDFFEDYFDMSTDYQKILNGFKGDKVLERAVKYCGGIRILKQDKWEALASFILSSNNNIKRIKGIIEKFCSLLGEQINGGYAFPTAEIVSKLNEDDLQPIRAGFRASYLIDAAKKVTEKTVDLEKIDNLDLESAKENLKQIRGVGDKVAQCVLLFGYHKMDAFPIDIWMKKALKKTIPMALADK